MDHSFAATWLPVGTNEQTPDRAMFVENAEPRDLRFRRMLVISAALCATAFPSALAQKPDLSDITEQAIAAPISLQRARLEVTAAYSRLSSDEARAQALLDLLQNRLSNAEDVAQRRDVLLDRMPGMDRFRELRNNVIDPTHARLGGPFPDLDPAPMARLGRLAEAALMKVGARIES